MLRETVREPFLIRLKADDISLTNQHYIVTHFIRKDIINAITDYSSGDLLDIGCGNKPYKKFFDGTIRSYVGCDIVQSSENVVDDICAATGLCYEAEQFDTIFSTQVLEHVADHSKMIEEAYRVLKPGGHVILTVPFAWELHEEPYDFFRFSKHGLHHLLEKHHFEIISLKANGGKWAAMFQLILNVLFSTRKYKTFRSGVIKFLFVRLKLIVLYNKFAIWLDNKYFDDNLTLNYIVIAKKLRPFKNVTHST